MQPYKELTLEEKIFLIENHGLNAAEVHQDPNPHMAFTRFAGPDPGAKSEDEDYAHSTTKRKLETEPSTPAKAVKKAKQVKTPATKPASPSSDKLKIWQEDEIKFVLERFAEYPEIGNTTLAFLVNEEFRDKPVVGGNGVETRGDRSRQSLWQRFSSRGTVETLIARLNEQTDVNAPSMGWKAKGMQGA